MADQVLVTDIQSDQASHVTLLRDQVTATKVRLFGSPFTGPGINSGLDVASGTFPDATTDVGSGVGGIVSGQLEMRTGVAPGSSLLRSTVLAYFVTGSVTGFESGVQVPTTPMTFSVVSLKAGVPSVVGSAAFSVVPNAPIDDLFHRYSMEFHGSDAIFYQDAYALHRMSGNVATQRTGTLDLPLAYEVTNSGGVTTVRWGMYSDFATGDGYFFQATYAATDVTMNVRGSSALQFGPIALVSGNVVSQSNSSTAALGAGATFTGVGENVLTYQEIDISLAGLPGAAAGTLYFEFSPDNIHWDISVPFVVASPNFVISKPLRVILPWFRVRYINGATPLTEFRLTTFLHRLSATRLTRFPGQVPGLEEPVEVAKAILAASDGVASPDTTFPNLTTTLVGAAQALDVVVKSESVADFLSGKVATSATTEVAVRATAYTEQVAGAQRSLSSTSANDTAAGTGARTVRVKYFVLSGSVVTGPFYETVTLNGVAAVNMVATDVCFIDSAGIEVLTAGSGGVNAGTIQLWTGVGGAGSVFASIAVGDRRTFYAHHYVASGQTLSLAGLTASSTAGSGNVPVFSVRSKSVVLANAAEQFMVYQFAAQGSSGTNQVAFATPREVSGPARVTVYVTPENGTAQVQRFECTFFEAPT